MLIGLAALLTLLAGVAPAQATTPADRAATDSFLRATLSLEQAIIANGASSSAAVTAAARSLEAECSGVLTHAPVRSLEEPPPAGGARAHGERDRQTSQLFALHLEVDFGLSAAGFAPDREAIAAYASAVSPLHWSDPQVGELVGDALHQLQDEAEAPTTSVCADLQAWVASGYRTATAATRQEGARFAALLKAALVDADTSSADSLVARIERYEGAPQRALQERIQALLGTSEPLPGAKAVGRQLGTALGFAEAPEERSEHPRGTEIGQGTTLADTHYVVRVEHTPLIGCTFAASVESSSPPPIVPGTGVEITSSGALGACPEHAGGASATASCADGLATIEYRTLPATRRVRLRLSNGRTYSSTVSLVPRRLGGPAGIYYQTVRTPPDPVSLTELDGKGRLLRVVAVRMPRGCSAPPAPTPLTLARVQADGGALYVIRGSVLGLRGRFLFNLELVPGSAEGALPGGGEDSASGLRSGPLQWNLSVSCEPGGAIVYALLRIPADQVLARTGTGLMPLTAASIPARLHAGGDLVYGAFASVPSELVVRSPSGASVLTVNLAAQASELNEYCAGYTGA